MQPKHFDYLWKRFKTTTRKKKKLKKWDCYVQGQFHFLHHIETVIYKDDFVFLKERNKKNWLSESSLTTWPYLKKQNQRIYFTNLN